MQQFRPAGYPAGPQQQQQQQQQQQVYAAGMAMPAGAPGFALGVPLGGSAAQAVASPPAAALPPNLADTATSPPSQPQQPAVYAHPYPRPMAVIGMPAGATGAAPHAMQGMVLPFPTAPAQPLMQQPGAAAPPPPPAMQFIPNR